MGFLNNIKLFFVYIYIYIYIFTDVSDIIWGKTLLIYILISKQLFKRKNV